MTPSLFEKTVGSRPAFNGRLLKVDVVDVELPSGIRSTREIVRHPGAAAILAETQDGRFVLVRQYRKPVEKILIEAVAGTLHPGEDPDACAEREVLEETGYRVRRLTKLGAVYAAPGYADEMLHLYHAELHPSRGEARPDADEHVAPLLLSREQIEDGIRNGEIEDAKTLAVWLLWTSKGGAA
jgi:ADP-ribose pyrophosphatase